MVPCKHNKYLMVIQPYSGTFDTPAPSSLPVRQVQLNTTMKKNINTVKSSFFHHLVQIANESSQVDFDVVEHTQLLRAVLAFSFFANLVQEEKMTSNLIVFSFLTVVSYNNIGTHELNDFSKSVKPLCHVHCQLEEKHNSEEAFGQSVFS